MSRLAAMKEYAFMKALKDRGLPVPEPKGQNRHTIVMELVDAFPLRQVANVPDPASLYGDLMEMVLRLAGLGLIHGDFNEFNVLIKEKEERGPVRSEESEKHATTEGAAEAAFSSSSLSTDQDHPSTDHPEHQQKQNSSYSSSPASASPSYPRPLSSPPFPQLPAESLPKSTSRPSPATPTIIPVPILIDFPQMLSLDHLNAALYFARDVSCIKKYFQRRFGFVSDEPGPTFDDARRRLEKGQRGLQPQRRPRAREERAHGEDSQGTKSEGDAGGTLALADRLDIAVEASGFSKKMARELEEYMKEVGVRGDGDDGGNGSSSAGDGQRFGEDDDNGDDDIDDDDDDDNENNNSSNNK